MLPFVQRRVRRGAYSLCVSACVAASLSAQPLESPLDLAGDAVEPSHAQFRWLQSARLAYRERSLTDSVARAHLEQIDRTLERWRALPSAHEAEAIVVNIPEFRLYAFRTDSLGRRDTLSMDVVVGTSGSQTPRFSDSIRYLEFAPYWNVPRSIVESELLPIARRDPHLLTVNNYEVVNQRARVLPMSAATIQLLSDGKAWLRQLPGGTNALGKVKFMFPNEHDVYLHDTPVQRDFLAARRDASHGCIRVAHPEALARWLLGGEAAWTDAAVEAAMNARHPQRVTLTRPVPVHLIYATAVAQEDGSVEFFDDIYHLNEPSGTRQASAPGAR
jgi:L,D-transpeptidase YcbB